MAPAPHSRRAYGGALGVGWLGICTRLHFQTAWPLALRYGGLYGRCASMGPRGIFRCGNCWLSAAMVTPPPARGGWGGKLSSALCSHSAEFGCFFYLPAWLKPPTGLTSKFFRFEASVSFFSNRRFSQISIIFGSLGGGEKSPFPPPTYFSSKKSFLTHRIWQ